MDDRPIEFVLQDSSHIETLESSSLRLRALEIIRPSGDYLRRKSDLPDALLQLLTEIIKPLFSESLHPKLTSTGRKVLVKDALPSSVIDRFSAFELEDGTNRPLWKNGWSSRLLLHILRSYTDVGNKDDETGFAIRKKTIEAHFYLLVPPILKQLDDMQILYKASGCECLQVLCTNLSDVHSRLLKQSGLMDVFVEALKNNFSMLPTLTSEDESLELYKALYPAYRYLVRAFDDASKERSVSQINDKHQSYLTLLLRHQLMHSLVHLSTGIGGGSTMSVSLSTLLISQIGWIMLDMGSAAVIHLQNLLPLLGNILADPFGTGAAEMLLETIKALQEIMKICWPRIKEKWWGECLRGIVPCWLNVCDDQNDIPSEADNIRSNRLVEVKWQLKITACLLKDISGVEITQTIRDLVLEAPELADLFTLSGQPSKGSGKSPVSETQSSKA